MQSKLGSLAESLTNIGIGITICFLSNIIVLPAFGYDVTIGDATMISIVFTVISLVRSYVIRRVYNKYTFFGKSKKPVCFGSNPSYQGQAENDCCRCDANNECLTKEKNQ